MELCRSLIEMGADKTALAYEGPASNILSVIQILVLGVNDL